MMASKISLGSLILLAGVAYFSLVNQIQAKVVTEEMLSNLKAGQVIKRGEELIKGQQNKISTLDNKLKILSSKIEVKEVVINSLFKQIVADKERFKKQSDSLELGNEIYPDWNNMTWDELYDHTNSLKSEIKVSEKVLSGHKRELKFIRSERQYVRSQIRIAKPTLTDGETFITMYKELGKPEYKPEDINKYNKGFVDSMTAIANKLLSMVVEEPERPGPVIIKVKSREQLLRELAEGTGIGVLPNIKETTEGF